MTAASATEYPAPYQRPDEIWVISRAEFASSRFDYKPGEHVLFGGPTQRAGKTTLAFALLEHVATPQCPAYIAVSKPKDPTTEKNAKRLGYRFVKDWPATKKLNEFWDGPPPGYVIWPTFGDMYTDTARCAAVTERLLADRYSAGVKNKHGILVMDDTYVKAKLMGLDKSMTQHLAMSGAMGIGEWVFVQRPMGSGGTAIWAYSQASHIFIAPDPDKKNRARYDEIGGVDPQLVADVSQSLTRYQFLYISRDGYICVVDSD